MRLTRLGVSCYDPTFPTLQTPGRCLRLPSLPNQFPSDESPYPYYTRSLHHPYPLPLPSFRVDLPRKGTSPDPLSCLLLSSVLVRGHPYSINPTHPFPLEGGGWRDRCLLSLVSGTPFQRTRGLDGEFPGGTCGAVRSYVRRRASINKNNGFVGGICFENV